MKKFTNLFLILIATSLMWSCSEEISEEIQDSNQSSPTSETNDGSGTVIPDLEGSSIRVINSLSGSYIMHKAGSFEEACEIPSPADGFDSADYANNNPDTAIDCILDAEEFDLYFGGAELNVQVDPNLCEYIDYQPFKFFDWQPGFTTRSVHRIECDDFCAGLNPTICNQTFATESSGTFSNPVTSTALSSLCQFDYSDESSGDQSGPNCDSGNVTTTVYDLTSIETPAADPNDPPVVSCPGSPTITGVEAESCGGELSACYGGAATETDELELDEQSLITENPSLQDIDVDIEVTSPFENNLRSNLHIANFSRVCSSVGNTKIDADFDTALVNIQGDQIETIASTDIFQPIVVDENEDGSDDYVITAIHPFNGVATNSRPSNDIIPYYSIKCLDSARDIKAQIRVHIREWDRVIDPENLFISRLSDVNQGANSRMDAEGNQGIGNPWNDFLDWDDHLVDFDLDSSADSNPNDGTVFSDPVFINNQCLDINTGSCFDNGTGAADPAFTNQTTCNGASASHIWIPNRDSFPEFRN